MANRASSVNLTDSGISREIGTQYANVKTVAENIQAVAAVAQMDFEEIIENLENAADFSGITVVSGEEAGWDSVNKVITVPTVKGDTGPKGDTGDQGLKGDKGDTGNTGAAGASAYQVATMNGFAGTEPQWLLSLVGPTGATGNNGLNGVDGEDGNSVTITSITHLGNGVFNWLFSDGFNYTTPSLVGPVGAAGTNGTNGVNGSDGLSAYQVAVSNGFVGTQTAWLASLVGPAGTNGTNGVDGTDGVDGTNGTDGASAYEIALSNGFVGTEIEWLTSLEGADGEQGIQGEPGLQGEQGETGLSAYEVALANGFIGTESEWLKSLVGESGSGGSQSNVNNVTYQWDFLSNSTNADIWSGGAISSGNAAGSAGVIMSSNHPGVLRLGSASAGTANSGYRFLSGTNNANGGLLVSDGTKFTGIFATPGGTTESYIGIHNAGTSSEPSTGAYIHVQNLTITAKTAQNGSSSSAVLGTISADTFYTVIIEANFTDGFVFEIRDTAGTLVYTGTITTTLPSSVTGCGITAYTTTATSQTCAYIDYMRLQVPSLARG